MGIKETLALTPANLAENQRQALLKHVEETFYEMMQYLKASKFATARALTFNSPAGDECGMDSTCINFFADVPEDEEGDGISFQERVFDMGQVIDKLEELSK